MHRLKSVGMVSFGKLMGVIGVFVGLLIGLIYGGFLILFGLAGAAGGQQGAPGMAAFGIGGGVAMMVLAPLFYGLFSFVFGLLYALIINLGLHFCGGLELEFEQP
jgi:hypothetical protein